MSVASSSSQFQQKDPEGCGESFASFTSEPGQAQTCLVERLEWKDSFRIRCGAIVRCGLMKPFDTRKNQKQNKCGQESPDITLELHILIPSGRTGRTTSTSQSLYLLWDQAEHFLLYHNIRGMQKNRGVGQHSEVSGQLKEPL